MTLLLVYFVVKLCRWFKENIHKDLPASKGETILRIITRYSLANFIASITTYKMEVRFLLLTIVMRKFTLTLVSITARPCRQFIRNTRPSIYKTTILWQIFAKTMLPTALLTSCGMILNNLRVLFSFADSRNISIILLCVKIWLLKLGMFSPFLSKGLCKTRDDQYLYIS